MNEEHQARPYGSRFPRRSSSLDDQGSPVSQAITDKRWYSIAQAAGYLDVTERTIHSLIASGQLPAHQLADRRRIRIDHADLDALMVPRTSGGAA